MTSSSAGVLELRRDGEAVARARVADSVVSRGVGLLGKSSLPPGEGLLISPCSSVHTWFMRFTIDVVYLDREWRVVRVVPELKPWRFSFGGRRAKQVIEFAAGEAGRMGLQRGDRLEGVPA